MLRRIRSLIPISVFLSLQPYYHRALAFLAAFRYGFPSRRLVVIGVTGTNGKSTTVELISQILEEAGFKTASFSSVRSRIAGEENRNKLKMTMPGRFQLQKFLNEAGAKGCTHAVIEVTSEGIKQFRHRHIRFHLAVVTNVTPEHIESHGSFESYRAAKGELFRITPVHVLNESDKDNFAYFSRIPARQIISYHPSDFPPDIRLKLKGDFNRENAMAALTVVRALGIRDDVSRRVLERVSSIPGRLEFVKEAPFSVIVDYAHTPDALEKVYKTLLPSRLICVFGSCGGGRDVWKRPEMGRIAGEYCAEIILTNEDPYDEDPEGIVRDIENGLRLAPRVVSGELPYKKVTDRREAIRQALQHAATGDTVIITGKGSESCIMGPGGSRMPWDDREAVREELRGLEGR